MKALKDVDIKSEELDMGDDDKDDVAVVSTHE